MGAPGTTPGPWSVPHFATDHTCECRYVLSDGQRGMGAIATVHHDGERSAGAEENEPREVAIANAHQIAASPALYDALEDCLSLIDDMSRFVGQMSLRDYALFNKAPIKARIALRLARGEGA